MNKFTKKIRLGEDTFLRIFLCNNETGEAEDLSNATLSVVLTNNIHEISIPSGAILRNLSFLKNEFMIVLTSDITSLMKAGMYHAKVTASYPDSMFPDGNRVVKYLDENVCQVIG